MKQKHNHKKIFPACALLAAAGLAMAAAGCLLGGWVYGIQFDTQTNPGQVPACTPGCPKGCAKRTLTKENIRITPARTGKSILSK